MPTEGTNPQQHSRSKGLRRWFASTFKIAMPSFASGLFWQAGGPGRLLSSIFLSLWFGLFFVSKRFSSGRCFVADFPQVLGLREQGRDVFLKSMDPVATV